MQDICSYHKCDIKKKKREVGKFNIEELHKQESQKSRLKKKCALVFTPVIL